MPASPTPPTAHLGRHGGTANSVPPEGGAMRWGEVCFASAASPEEGLARPLPTAASEFRDEIV